MKINLNEFKLKSLSIDDVSTIVDINERCEYDVTYTHLNQSANAKSMINLLAINICNEPYGTFVYDDKEEQKNIDEIIKFLKKKQ